MFIINLLLLFCFFYLRFIEGSESLNMDFWAQNVTSPSIVVWCGLAFENVCFHIPQIKKVLGISGVITRQSAWTKRPDETECVQEDLIIERRDNVANMCEIKFYSDDFSVDNDCYRTILRRSRILCDFLPKKMIVHNTLIATFGLAYNAYSSIFSNVVTLEDLFST